MRNLSQFIGEFREGFQSQNRFRAAIFPPAEMLLKVREALTNPFQGGIGQTLENIGEASDLLVQMPLIAQWLGRGVLVNSTRLPTRAVEAVDHRMYGVTERMPYNTEYTNIHVSMLVPLMLKDAGVPRFFNIWQNMIQNQLHGVEDGSDMGFPDDYYGSMILALMDRQNYPTIVYKFERIYPATVESSELNWQTINEVMPFGITFNYSYHKILHRTSPEALALTAAAIIGQ